MGEGGGASPTPARPYAPPRGCMVASVRFDERFVKLIRGHWLDSIGNSIIVSQYSEEQQLTAVLTPLIDHPEARDRVFTIRHDRSRSWRCGNANLEWADEQHGRLVWTTEDGRRSVWSRTNAGDKASVDSDDESGPAFPWLMNTSVPEPWLPLSDVPRDILYDGARIAALLDIRQMIGPVKEPQERLTHILMDHDLHQMRGDYLIPGAESPLWQTLPVSETLRQNIGQRIHRIPHEAYSQRISWHSETEILVGHHKISCRARDIQVLESRWMLPPKDGRKRLEIARLLALYSVFDNPLSNRRNGVHLGLEPQLRHQCDYELFASPLNAVCPNGHFASKWPHVEWRFGSVGSYPTVLSVLPANAVLCVNPPFTEAYLADVMSRLTNLKCRFRLRIAVPIQEVPWRRKLLSSLPSARLLRTYYDASSDRTVEVLHPTLLWEDPRCSPADLDENTFVEVSYEEVGCGGCQEGGEPTYDGQAPDPRPPEHAWGPQPLEQAPPAVGTPSTPLTPDPTPLLAPAPSPVPAATSSVMMPGCEVPSDLEFVVAPNSPVSASAPSNPVSAGAPGSPVGAREEQAGNAEAHALSPGTSAQAAQAGSPKQRRAVVGGAAAASISKGRARPKGAAVGGGPAAASKDPAVPAAAPPASAAEGRGAELAAPPAEAADPDAPALDADEWPALSSLKQPARRSIKARR